MNVSHSHSRLSVMSTDEDRGLGNMSGSYLCCRSPSLSCPLHSQAELKFKKGLWIKEKSDWQRWKRMQIYFFEVKLFLGFSLKHSYGFYNRYLQRRTVMWGHLDGLPTVHSSSQRPRSSCFKYEEKVSLKKSFRPQVETVILKWGQSVHKQERCSTTNFTSWISIAKKTTCGKSLVTLL